MFSKAYKLKSNTTLKNSEKKHLCQRIQNEFPSVSDEKVKELVPNKSSCSCMKLVLNSGETVGVFVVDAAPMMVETGDGLVPTLCALWKVPALLPTITIHTPVLNKIQGGAPLYLPGVNIPQCGVGFPLFRSGQLVAVCTQDNAAAAVVGRTLMSSADMLLRTAGVCLETLHVFGDALCKEQKFSKQERPKISPNSQVATELATEVQQLSLQPVKEEWPSLGRAASVPTPASKPTPPVQNEPRLITEQPLNIDLDGAGNHDQESISTVEQCEVPSDMDGLLQWCLLSFIKLQGKQMELPLLTNLLYRNHLIPLCPDDRTLDIKKSSYKKVGKFLEAMQQEGLIEVSELDKGVSAVVALNVAHPRVRSHRAPPQVHPQMPQAPGSEARHYEPPRVRDVYCVTAAVLALFTPHKKGTALTSAEIRSTLTEYVKSRNLTAAQSRGTVALDAVLANAIGKTEQEIIKWDALMSLVQSRMTAATEMQFADGAVTLIKSRLEPIKMQLANRSGNKKVTLVSNLESFGFNLVELSHACQLGVAASCRVARSPGATADQLMLQGDQTHFVAKLLIEKYGLPKKFLDGADKALNKKK